MDTTKEILELKQKIKEVDNKLIKLEKIRIRTAEKTKVLLEQRSCLYSCLFDVSVSFPVYDDGIKEAEKQLNDMLEKIDEEEKKYNKVKL